MSSGVSNSRERIAASMERVADDIGRVADTLKRIETILKKSLFLGQTWPYYRVLRGVR